MRQELKQTTGLTPRQFEGATHKLYDASGGLCQRAWVEIDQAALFHNVQQLTTLLAAQPN
jgi:alanine racemase